MEKNSSGLQPRSFQQRWTGIDTPAWKPIFPGTSTTILADTQHALILNYVDTKPCSARESLPYRQEQHPRLSSRRTFVGDYPRYRDLSTLLPLDHPWKGVKRPFRPFPSLSLFLLSAEPSFLYSAFRSTQNRPSSPCFFFWSPLLILRLVDGEKKGFVRLFFQKIDRVYVSSLFVYVQKTLPPRETFHRIDSDWFLSIRLLIL